jgi:electron transfer flavoprotein alpha subunit
MSEIWIIVDDQCGVGAALDALGAPGETVSALVVGDRSTAEHTSRSVGDVRWIDAGGSPAEAWANAAAALVGAAAPPIVAGAATPGGRALMGAIAVRLNTPLVSNVLTVRRQGDGAEAEQSDLGGRVILTLSMPVPACVLVTPADVDPPVCDVPAAITPVEAVPDAIVRVKVEPGVMSRVTEAERVVSVGRGLGSREALSAVEALAAELGAEIGCSMPVADELGWVARERYVGVSGQHISPKLYVALGISGMPQHLFGIRNAQTVVAVNSDPRAPIFNAADYGIVGDLHEVVPALIEALK